MKTIMMTLEGKEEMVTMQMIMVTEEAGEDKNDETR